MAKGDIMGGGRGRGSFDRNRDGVDDQIDRAPGNDSDSREYARRYDYGSQNEFSVLPERSQQLRDAENERIRMRQKQANEATLSAQSRVQFFPNLGKFIIPRENSWAAHARLVNEERTDLSFNPAKYPAFDAIIAQRCGIEGLYNPAHKDYKKYEGLRTNLEVLRNDIMGFYLNDGSFDAGDEKYVPYMASIAETLGDALANDRWHKRPFSQPMSVDVANVEGTGAAEMYKYLLSRQDYNGPFSLLIANIKVNLLGMDDHRWGLEAIENTPFSPANMSVPAPHQGVFFNEQELVNTCAQPSMQEKVEIKKRQEKFTDALAQEKLAQTLVPGYKGLA